MTLFKRISFVRFLPKVSAGLTTQIIALVCIPLAVLLVTVGLSLKDDLEASNRSSEALSQVDLFQSASRVIHELQLERGMSAAFLKGNIPPAELEAQHRMTEERLGVLEPALKGIKLIGVPSDESVLRQELLALRSSVTGKKVQASEAVTEYTRLIADLTGVQLAIGYEMGSSKYGSNIRGLLMIEAAKENAGRLRALVTNILNNNTAIEPSQFRMLTTLKAGVDTNLTSPGLSVSAVTKEQLKDFRTSAGWQKVTEVFELILKQAERGQYNEDPKVFFRTITDSIDELGSILASQGDLIRWQIRQDQAKAKSAFWTLGAVMTGLLLVLAISSFFVVRAISRRMHEAIDHLKLATDQIAVSSDALAGSNDKIVQTAEGSSSAFVETSAALDSVNQGIIKTADNAKSASELSEVSQASALKGKEVVEQMSVSINDIHQCNSMIADQIAETNQQLGEIIHLIKDIGTRTQVINDIVFQTRLLSFNASVEAARAGQHGRGFSIVAEEVGKLAQMSGEAAKDITSMLAGSIKKVEDIVTSTRSKIDALIVKGSQTVDHGLRISEECRTILEDIVQNASNTSQMVGEITFATEMQKVGIEEITSAMNSMNETIQQNGEIAASGKADSELLSGQIHRLESVVMSLVEAVNGGKAAGSGGNTASVAVVPLPEAAAPKLERDKAA